MDKLVIGKIINTRGLKGEIKVENHSSFVKERYKVGETIYLSNDELNFMEKKIIKFNYVKGFVYLFLEGIDSIDKANLYRDYYIYCSSDNLNENEDTFHYLTLVDMQVVSKGKVIGKVIDIENNTKQDLIRVSDGNKSFLLPFLKEFIVRIDRENKVIEFKNIEAFYEN